MTSLRFAIDGTPKPKGSLRHVGHGRLIEQVDNGAWKQAAVIAAATARDKHAWTTIAGRPVVVRIDFHIPRVPSAPKRLWPITRSSGDIDKLTRLVLDALTQAHIIGDDSQVTNLHVTKAYDDHPGATVAVGEA